MGSINLTNYHIFPWLCAWDVCYIIFCHLLHIHSRKTGILFSLILCRLWWVQIFGYVLACKSCSFVCTLHHLIIIIVRTYLRTLNLWNACQIYFVECVSKIKHIFSVIHNTIYGAVCFQFTHFPLWWWREYTFCLIIIIKSEVWTIIHCLGLGHETMVCAVCRSIFLFNELFENILCQQIMNFLQGDNVLFKYQFVFRKIYSTDFALIEFTGKVRCPLVIKVPKSKVYSWTSRRHLIQSITR